MITVSISGLPAGAMTDQSLAYPKCSILFSCLVQLAIATGADKQLDLKFAKRAFSKFVDTFYGARTNPLILKAGIDGSKLDGDYHCTLSLDTYNELIAGNGDNYISIAFSTFDVASTREFVRRVMATYMQCATIDGGLVQDIQHWCLGNKRMNTLPLDIVDTPLGGQPSVDFMLSKTGREWGVITETGDSGVQVPITKPPAQVLLDFTRSYDHVYNGDRIFIATSLDATTRTITATETDRLLKIVRQVLDFAGSPTADNTPVIQAIVPANVNQAIVNTLLANGFNVRMIAERFTDHLPIVIVAAQGGSVSMQVAGWPRTKVTLDAKTLNNVRVLRDVAHDFDIALSREVLSDPEFNIEQVFQSTGTLSIEMTPLLRILPRVREYEWVTLV